MSFRRRLKGKQPPEGWDLIESSVEDFEQQMRDAVNEEHEGECLSRLDPTAETCDVWWP